MKVLVKKVNVCEFSDCDKINILSATILMKNNFGFFKFYELRIDKVLSNGDFGNFNGPLVN